MGSIALPNLVLPVSCLSISLIPLFLKKSNTRGSSSHRILQKLCSRWHLISSIRFLQRKAKGSTKDKVADSIRCDGYSFILPSPSTEFGCAHLMPIHLLDPSGFESRRFLEILRESIMLRLQIEPRREVNEQFFDTNEELSSTYDDSCPISPVTCLTSPISPATCLASPISPATRAPSPIGRNHLNVVSPGPYKLWIGAPLSIEDRRVEFKKWMCLTPTPRSTSVGEGGMQRDAESQTYTDACTSSSDLSKPSCSSDRGSFPSTSRWSSSEHSRSSEDRLPSESVLHKIANWDDNSDAFVGAMLDRSSSGSMRFSDLVSDQMLVADGVPKAMMPPDYVGHFLRRGDSGSSRSSVISTTSSNESIGTKRRKWLKRLGMMACIVDRQEDEEGSFKSYVVDSDAKEKAVRVKVHLFWKRSREFSAVFKEQDFRAHDGVIWAMKFSPDGRYLATGGDDGVVRVWSVTERARGSDGILDTTVKSGGSTDGRKPDSVHVVVPPRVFRLSEEPLHRFHGHNGDVLDLSWSKDKYLISSSLDKTVRLWQVGCENCLRVFRHNNYVTCVQFNPTDENFFVSGSIDGKVRVWDISSCHVVDWSDMTELVTAVCFTPDGKGVVVGSIIGNCRFFKMTDNRLQVDMDVSFHGKKGSTRKRITGLQFSQSSPAKLLVTSADSQIRVLDKFVVVHKYKGFRNAGSLISASFTRDGRHIVSASEDSNVFIWSHTNKSAAPVNRAKITRSYERFFSDEASVAIPWNGLFATSPSQSEDFTFQTEGSKQSESLDRCSTSNFRSSAESSSCKSISTTWPEEARGSASVNGASHEQRVSKCKSQRHGCEGMASSPTPWGQVIVTAGCDGRIRVFCNYGLPVHG